MANAEVKAKILAMQKRIESIKNRNKLKSVEIGKLKNNINSRKVKQHDLHSKMKQTSTIDRETIKNERNWFLEKNTKTTYLLN